MPSLAFSFSAVAPAPLPLPPAPIIATFLPFFLRRCSSAFGRFSLRLPLRICSPLFWDDFRPILPRFPPCPNGWPLTFRCTRKRPLCAPCAVGPSRGVCRLCVALAPLPLRCCSASYSMFFLRRCANYRHLSAVSSCTNPPPIFLACLCPRGSGRAHFSLVRTPSLSRTSPSHVRTSSSLARTPFPSCAHSPFPPFRPNFRNSFCGRPARLVLPPPCVSVLRGRPALRRTNRWRATGSFCRLPIRLVLSPPTAVPPLPHADSSPSSLLPCSSPHILQRAARRVRAEIRHKIPVNPHGKHGAPSPKNTARNPTSDYINIYRLHTTLYGDYLHRLPLGLAPPHRDRDTCARKRAFRGGVSLFKMSHLHFRLLFEGCRCGAERQFSPREVSRGGGFLQRRLGGFISCGCELSFSMKRRLPTEPRFCTPVGERRGRQGRRLVMHGRPPLTVVFPTLCGGRFRSEESGARTPCGDDARCRGEIGGARCRGGRRRRGIYRVLSGVKNGEKQLLITPFYGC